MTDKPTEQKESLLTFPCDFTIKVFGLANTDFEAAALTIVRQHVPTFSDTMIVSRPSENGKYLALSITIHAESKAQIDNIYQSFTDSPHIIMAL